MMANVRIRTLVISHDNRLRRLHPMTRMFGSEHWRAHGSGSTDSEKSLPHDAACDHVHIVRGLR
jgi:hypothetical protein